jgi:hypothetical protein
VNEIDKMIEDVKDEFLKMSNQARTLGVGLENVAPGDKAKVNHTIQYLLIIADKLNHIAASCDVLLPNAHHHTKRRDEP